MRNTKLGAVVFKTALMLNFGRAEVSWFCRMPAWMMHG